MLDGEGQPSPQPARAMKGKNVPKGARGHLAMNVRMARTIAGWSQEALGLQCGLKRTYIGALERADLNPGVDNVERIARGLGLPAHVLLLEPDAAQPKIYRQLGSVAATRRRPAVRLR